MVEERLIFAAIVFNFSYCNYNSELIFNFLTSEINQGDPLYLQNQQNVNQNTNIPMKRFSGEKEPSEHIKRANMSSYKKNEKFENEKI